MLIEILDEEAKLKGRKPGHGVTNRELLIRRLFDRAVEANDAALLRLIFSYHDGKPPEPAPEDDGLVTDSPKRIIIPESDDRHAND